MTKPLGDLIVSPGYWTSDNGGPVHQKSRKLTLRDALFDWLLLRNFLSVPDTMKHVDMTLERMEKELRGEVS